MRTRRSVSFGMGLLAAMLVVACGNQSGSSVRGIEGSASASSAPVTSAVTADTDRHTGTITRIIQNRGFAFVRTDDDGTEIFVHHSALPRGVFDTLNEGDRLAFDIETDVRGRGQRASNIEIIGEQP